jgi:hypothetical protein
MHAFAACADPEVRDVPGMIEQSVHDFMARGWRQRGHGGGRLA